MSRRREKERTQTVSEQPTIRETLSHYTVDALQGVRRTLGIIGVSGLRKADLIAALAERLMSEHILRSAVESLSPDEREALKFVLSHGGVVYWDEFVDRFDCDVDESPYWDVSEPETIMGRLRVRGFIGVGSIRGKPSVFVPIELREPLMGLVKD